MVAEDSGDAAYGAAAGSLTVLAGIASCDAACCAALKERSRGQNHQDAIGVVKRITPSGAEAAKRLKSLLDLKDSANYGMVDISEAKLRKAIRDSAWLLEWSDGMVSR